MDINVNDLIKELPANVFFSLWIVPLLHKLKKSRSKWLSMFTEETAPIWSGFLAVVTALGIHTNFTFNADNSFQLVIDGTLAGILQGSFEIGKQFTAQHWMHKVYKLANLLTAALDAEPANESVIIEK